VTATPTPAVGQLRVSVTGLPAAPSLSPGGAPIQFTVVVSNGTAGTLSGITPIVYLDHCTCVHEPIPLAPDGSLQLRQANGSWKTVVYDSVGGGTDYLSANQVGPQTLRPGANVSFTFRLSFTAKQTAPVSAGTTSLDVAVVTLSNHTPISGASTQIPLTVTAA
jgi:hypothetical protein